MKRNRKTFKSVNWDEGQTPLLLLMHARKRQKHIEWLDEAIHSDSPGVLKIVVFSNCILL